MSKKSNKGILAVVAIAIVAAAGVMYFLSQNVENLPASGDQYIEASAEQRNAEGTTDEATNEDTDVAEVSTAAGGDQATETALNPQGTEVEPGNPVVAVVDGKEITRVDVYRYIKSMPQNLQQLPAATIYPLALEQVVNMRLVQNKAEAAKLGENEEVLKELEMAKQQIIRNVYLQEQVDKKISDADLKKLYKEYIAKVPDVKQRRASHILLENEEKAKEVIAKLEDGADFATLAQEMSTGPTGPKGGDLGFFAKEEMVPEFAEAAFSINKGAYSNKPVKTEFGYHVIKVTDTRDLPKPTFEEMKPNLEAEKRREVLDGLVKKWRADSKIEQFDINGKPLKQADAAPKE